MTNKQQSEDQTKRKHFRIKPIGFIRSDLKRRGDAPRQGREGAPNALIEVLPSYVKALHRMQVGDEIIIISWLHRAQRNVMEVHPRGDASRPLTGVFSTRSPDRPNPMGLHRVRVLGMDRGRLHVGRIEAIDGTPVIDIKPVIESNDY
jgi:tRNA-Thr(GGU) m(6)t(6)A37 methyltransferase TsaA